MLIVELSLGILALPSFALAPFLAALGSSSSASTLGSIWGGIWGGGWGAGRDRHTILIHNQHFLQ